MVRKFQFGSQLLGPKGTPLSYIYFALYLIKAAHTYIWLKRKLSLVGYIETTDKE